MLPYGFYARAYEPLVDDLKRRKPFLFWKCVHNGISEIEALEALQIWPDIETLGDLSYHLVDPEARSKGKDRGD